MHDFDYFAHLLVMHRADGLTWGGLQRSAPASGAELEVLKVLVNVLQAGNYSQAWPQCRHKDYLETVLPGSLLYGKTFLDIGAYQGFSSFFAELLGGAAVTSVDHCCWGGQELSSGQGAWTPCCGARHPQQPTAQKCD